MAAVGKTRLVPSRLLLLPRLLGDKAAKGGVRHSSNEAASPQKKDGFFQKLWNLGDTLPHTDAHSKILTKTQATYELQFDYVKPECMNQYLHEVSSNNKILSDSDDYPGQLLGSWTSIYGDLDLAVHLWINRSGYAGASAGYKYLSSDKVQQEFQEAKGQWLRSRNNQLLHEFGFWGEPEPREPSHIYELRSYSLKPGTLIEWGNNWSKAINIRKKDAVGGFFSQIGPLYEVHHMWAYDDMSHRKSRREKMWQTPGWGDCVAATVPLVRQMNARLLMPTADSPLQ